MTDLTHTMLVVEDSLAVRTMWRKFLTSQGYQVLEAGDGLQALDVLQNHRVDFVISDIDMPRMNGTDLLRELRRRHPFLPVVLVTGKPAVEAAVECMRVGALDYLSKPCNLARLAALITTALAKADAASLEQTAVRADGPKKFIGPYAIIRTLGEGAVGIVYLAEREGVQVAVKILRESALHQGLEGDAWRARFERETRITAGVRHPNLVPVLDFGTSGAGGVPYLVMPYVAGGDLESWLQREPRPDVPARLRLLIQLADGLAALHAAGICHRDIKPRNILVDEQQTARITDFGIARRPGNLTLTLPGELIGTPTYMAPEAFDDSKVDFRADLFALGGIAYLLLVGKPAFSADSLAILAHRIRTKDPLTPELLPPDFPPALRHILAQLLHKQPDQRYASARLAAADLRAYLASQLAALGTATSDAWAQVRQ